MLLKRRGFLASAGAAVAAVAAGAAVSQCGALHPQPSPPPPRADDGDELLGEAFARAFDENVWQIMASMERYDV